MANIELEVAVQYSWGDPFRLDVSFTSAEPISALFGPSGAGKSTLLACIAGLIRPKRGFIRIGPTVVFDDQKKINLPSRLRGVGCVFQNDLLFPHLSVEENLRFGMPKRAGAENLNAAVEALELHGMLERSPRTLSGGQKQRVSIARAVLSQPRLLLLDEPFSSMDDRMRTQAMNFLEGVTRRSETLVLFVTHRQLEVRRLADWMVVMENGGVRAVGPPADVLSLPATLALSSGLAPVNLLRFDEVRDGEDVRVGLYAGGELVLPMPAPHERSARHVAFDPNDVILAVQNLLGISARNQLRGHVLGLTPLFGRTLVAVDMGKGNTIWAEISPVAAAEMNLQAGQAVVCLIKTQSLKYV